MPSLAEINSLDRVDFTAALGFLFEHSPWVAERAWDRRPFRDARELHTQLCTTMHSAPPEQKLALIRAHPDLAGRLAPARELTAESTREQASAGLDRMTTDELATFEKFNGAYRAKFGFPFVICARLNAREAILAAMTSRLANTPEQEFSTALREIEKIAWLRLNDFLGGDSTL